MYKISIVIICLFFAMQSFSQTAKQYIEVMTERLTNAKAYTLAMAEAMPEAHYRFKPMDEEMSFGQQLVHIANNLTGISNRYITARATGFSPDVDANQKTAVIQFLTQSWDYAIATVGALTEQELAEKVKFFAGEKNKMQMVNLLNDHQAHHRGQIAVYLRLQGIAPPRYIGW